MYFLHTCRKLFLTSSIYNMYFCTETQSRSCRIHRYVSAADYNYLLRFHDRCVIIIAECLHQVISGQVLICGKYAVGISPGIPMNFGSPAPEPMKTAWKPSSSISSSIVIDFPITTFVSILTPSLRTFSISGCTTPLFGRRNSGMP